MLDQPSDTDMDESPMFTVRLSEHNARALIHAGELTGDVLGCDRLPLPDALSLAMCRLASALERSEFDTALGQSRR
jgi:hypothetical protein